MAGVRSFTDLRCWRAARRISKNIFESTKSSPFANDQRLVAQINDSSESVMANIAEGFGRGTQGEFIQFLGYAIGSLDETKSHLCAAYDRLYISREKFEEFWNESTDVRKMTVSLIGSMIRPGGGVKHMRQYKSFTEDVWERYERLTGKKRPAIFEQARQQWEDSRRERSPLNDNPPELQE